MSDLNIIRIGYPIQFTDSLHKAVISILPGADANQSIPRLNYIAYLLRLLLGLLLGFNLGNGWPLGWDLLGLCVRRGFPGLDVRVQGLRGLALLPGFLPLFYFLPLSGFLARAGFLPGALGLSVLPCILLVSAFQRWLYPGLSVLLPLLRLTRDGLSRHARRRLVCH